MDDLVVEFAQDHSCGAGHFPDNPIIPGALLLAEVLALIATELGAAGTWQVSSAKFPRAVRPGDQVAIDYSSAPSGEIRFNGSVVGRQVISGCARIAAAAPQGTPA